MALYDISNINFSEILTASFALFAVIDILGSIPVLISFKNKMGHISAWRATIVSGLLILLFFVLGERFLKILGLDISSFAIAGSIVLFILGLEMVLGMEFFKGDPNAKTAGTSPSARSGFQMPLLLKTPNCQRTNPASDRRNSAREPRNPTAIFSCNQLILTTGWESQIVGIPERLSKGVLENSKTVLTAHHRPS